MASLLLNIITSLAVLGLDLLISNITELPSQSCTQKAPFCSTHVLYWIYIYIVYQIYIVPVKDCRLCFASSHPFGSLCVILFID